MAGCARQALARRAQTAHPCCLPSSCAAFYLAYGFSSRPQALASQALLLLVAIHLDILHDWRLDAGDLHLELICT